MATTPFDPFTHHRDIVEAGKEQALRLFGRSRKPRLEIVRRQNGETASLPSRALVIAFGMIGSPVRALT